MFELSARYFDAHHEQSDGAFIGEMLTHDFVSVGDTWFVHKAVPDPTILIDPQSCSPAELHTLLTRKNCA